MPEKGGSSTVAGVEYQAWVAAEILADAVGDESIQVQLEGKADSDGNSLVIDDIIRIQETKKQYRNCKSQAPDAVKWGLSQLRGQGVLDQLKGQFLLEPHQDLYFVTESPCPLLQEAFSRAAFSSTAEEAKTRLLGGREGYWEDWEEARKYLGFSHQQMHQFSKRVRYERKVVQEIEKNILSRMQPHFSFSEAVPVLLKSLAQEAAVRGETLGRDEIVGYLRMHGCALKSSQNIDSIVDAFAVASTLVCNTSSTIGAKIHIEREYLRTLLDWVEQGQSRAKAAVASGGMGVGKTVLMKELFLAVQRIGLPCLAIKTDCYGHIRSLNQLSEELGLHEDLLRCVASVAESRGKCVVIFDQLDALSDSIARDRTAINIFASTILHLLSVPNVKVVASARRFDLEHDPTLSTLPFDPKLEVGPIAAEEAVSVLSRIGLDASIFSQSQLSLFRIPLHLRILAEVYDASIHAESIQTIQDLYRMLWERKVATNPNGQSKIDLVSRIVAIMDAQKNLSVPSSVGDIESQATTELLSNGILVTTGRQSVGFFHQSFFDYCFARSFVASGTSLAKKVISEHQGFFARSQIRQTLAFLRGADASKYISELTTLLLSPSVRFHVKDLILSLIGSQTVVLEEESEFLKTLFRQNDSLAHHFLSNAYTPIWFDLLEGEFFVSLLSSPKTAGIVEVFLLRIVNLRTDPVLDLVDSLSDSEVKRKVLARIFLELTNWTDAALSIFKQQRGQLDLFEGYLSHVLPVLYKHKPAASIDLFFSELDARIDRLSQNAEPGSENFIGWDLQDFFEKLINSDSVLAMEGFAARLRRIVSLTQYEGEHGFRRDRTFLLYELGETLYDSWKVMTLFADRLREHVKNGNVGLAKNVVSILSPTDSVTLNRVLCWIYIAAPELFVDQAYALLAQPDALTSIDGGHNSGYDARSLLSAMFPQFSERKREGIVESILGYEPDWEKGKDAGRFRGHSQYLCLSSIPLEMLPRHASARLAELQRKFGKHEESPPMPLEFGAVGPPLPDSAYLKMNLEQWFSSFRKYDESTSWDSPKRDFLKGGVIEHSRVFQAQIAKRPEYFYDFAFSIRNSGVSSYYISAAIEGFAEAKYDYDRTRALLLHYTDDSSREVRKSIIRAIGKLDTRAPIDISLLEVLAEYAEHDPDPVTERHTEKAPNGQAYYRGQALDYGINTVRGSAVLAIAHHGFRTKDPQRVFEILEKASGDHSVSVRACLVVDLHGMTRYDRHRAFGIFRSAARDLDPQVLQYSATFLQSFMHRGQCCAASRSPLRNLGQAIAAWLRKVSVNRPGQEFYRLPDSYSSLTPYLQRMTSIEGYEASKSTGKIAMLAVLHQFDGAVSFLNFAIRQERQVRIGAAAVCIQNMHIADCRSKCEKVLRMLLSRYPGDIAETVALHFARFAPKDFPVYYPFIVQLFTSSSDGRHLHFVMEYLSKCSAEYPTECIHIMEKLRQHGDVDYGLTDNDAVTIACSAYMKSTAVGDKERAMDLIDRMYLSGYRRIRQMVSELDR